MKSTPSITQIDEQIQLEKEAISQGLTRLQDQTIKLENQSYASASIYGITSIDTLLPSIIERIDKTKLKIHKGTFGQTFKEIHAYLTPIDSQSAAVIACKITEYAYSKQSAAKKRVAKIMAKAESTFLLVTQDSFHHMYPKEVGEPYEEDEYDAGEILD